MFPANPARRVILIALALALVVALAAIALLPGRSGADPAYDSEESQFLVLINQYRAQNGLGPLVSQIQLDQASDWFATDMATKNYFATNHVDSLGRDPDERAAAYGYFAPVGENIAAGVETAEQVIAAWKASSGHNANLLNPSRQVIGIGRAYSAASQYGWYWVTMFGDFFASTPTASPTPTPLTTTPATPATTATPTRSPSPTPSGSAGPQKRADTNCDNTIDSLDGLNILLARSNLAYTRPAGCGVIGTAAGAGSAYVVGDVNCDGQADSLDALIILLYTAHLPYTLPPGCPALDA